MPRAKRPLPIVARRMLVAVDAAIRHARACADNTGGRDLPPDARAHWRAVQRQTESLRERLVAVARRANANGPTPRGPRAFKSLGAASKQDLQDAATREGYVAVDVTRRARFVRTFAA